MPPRNDRAYGRRAEKWWDRTKGKLVALSEAFCQSAREWSRRTSLSFGLYGALSFSTEAKKSWAEFAPSVSRTPAIQMQGALNAKSFQIIAVFLSNNTLIQLVNDK